MQTFATVAVILGTFLVASARAQYQNGGNFVDDYSEYDQVRRGQPSPRSYPTDSASRQSAAPQNPKPTPVAILKQINRHNEDGSYTYGFEGGDGSFKIETKLPSGDVKGKYGFVDDTGKVRVVEYGANQYGFQPAGEGITVAPPTLVDETTGKDGLQPQDYDYQQPAPQAVRPAAPVYQPPQTHTQALYPSAQPLRTNTVPKPPIFSPSGPPRQSVLQQSYDDPAPPSQLYNQGPAQFGPAPGQEQRAQPQTRSQSGGLLDQLARDYALPQGVAPPLHDISFGYY